MSLQEGLRVAIDVSSEKHCVMMGHSARPEKKLEVDHSDEGFEKLFAGIEEFRQGEEPVWVLIEGAGGWFRPLDELIQRRVGYHLVSINNRKMARFRELFPGAPPRRMKSMPDGPCRLWTGG